MPLTLPWSKVYCPFCFEYFPLRRAPLRTVGSRAEKEPDHVVGKFFGTAPPKLGKVAEPPAEWWRHFFVPAESTEVRRLCPNCHILLPDKIANGEAGSEVIAVIGARSSGKSNYFGVLINHLRRRYCSEVGFDLIDGDTYGPSGRIATHDLYQGRYGKHLFGARPEAVPQTKPILGETVAVEQDPRIPLIYLLRFHKRWWHYATRPLAHRVPVYFMVYDAAGEDMSKQDSLEQYYRFIQRATSIIFLLDPFDYPGIRARLPESLRKLVGPPQTEPTRVIDHVIRLYQTHGGVRASGKIHVPVAFALTKSDRFAKIASVIHQNSTLVRDSTHRNGFDRAGCEALSREIEQHIRDWDSPELISKVEHNFSTYQFFAVSALGSQPTAKSQGEIVHLEQPISPIRIADPLLWLLWLRGYIPEVRA